VTRTRSLVVVPALPHPAYDGKDLRNLGTVDALTELGPVAVFGTCANDPRDETPPDLAGLERWRTTDDPRLAYPPPEGHHPGRRWIQTEDGHPIDVHYTDQAAEELLAFARKFDPEVILFEGLWMARYLMRVADAVSGTLVFDCHNVEADLHDRLDGDVRGSGLSVPGLGRLVAERTRLREAEALAAADSVWACSPTDRDRLAETHDVDCPVHVVPNGVDPTRFDGVVPDVPAASAVDGRGPVLVYPASYEYKPNALAAENLLEEVVPRLLAVHPEAHLVLAGKAPTPAMEAAAERDHVTVTGGLEDIRPTILAADVVPVPLRHGGGTRLKILEAFCAGVPVVSTTKGCEGLAVRDREHLLVAETPATIVEAIAELEATPELRASLVTEARNLFEERYTWSAIAETVAAAAHAAVAGSGDSSS
jgi:glycosyltransferase involved in cell wall biosynthesis